MLLHVRMRSDTSTRHLLRTLFEVADKVRSSQQVCILALCLVELVHSARSTSTRARLYRCMVHE